MNSKINEIQDIVINEIRKISKDLDKEELNRASVIANASQTFIKSVNLNFKIYEYAKTNNIDIAEINEKLGL